MVVATMQAGVFSYSGIKKNEASSIFLKQNNEDIKAKRLQSIKNKLKSGQRLSPADMEYLRNNDPVLYEKAVKIAEERDVYRRDLKRCKTKTDVHMVSIAKQMQLKLESKYEDPEIMFMRMSAISNEHFEFVKTGKYCDLPIDERDRKNKEDNESDEDNESNESNKNIKKPNEKTETDESREKPDEQKADKVSEKAENFTAYGCEKQKSSSSFKSVRA